MGSGSFVERVKHSVWMMCILKTRCGVWSNGPSYTHAWYVSIDESRSDTGMNAYGIYCRGFKCVSLGSCKNRECQMHVLMRENQ